MTSIGDLGKTANGLTVKVWVQDIGTGTIELTQDQLLNMIREGKAKGKQMKDPGTGTLYLKRDLEAELRK